MPPVIQFRGDDKLAGDVDAQVKRKGFKNRSEYLRSLVLADLSSADEGVVSGAAGTGPVDPPGDDGAGEQLPPSSPPPEPAPPGPPEAKVPAPQPSSPADAAPAPVILRGDQQLPPEPGKCPDCGAPDGLHHGFCVQVTGEEPVTGTEAPIDPVAHTAETQESYVGRRIAEQVGEGADEFLARSIAEAEWRAHRGAGRPIEAPAATQQPTRDPQASGYAAEACPGCGTVKLPTAQCRECGARPTIIL